MASSIDLCNLALSHLGQSKQITAISPPDGSAEAALCARYYPIARGLLLERHDWGFATSRVTLALSGTAAPSFDYRYAWPNGALKIQSVHLPDDDTPQEFAIEEDGGATYIHTNVEDAEAKYTALITDVNRYSGTFQMAFSELLASFLAGPIIKGKAGVAVAKELRASAFGWFGQAALLDAKGQKEQVRNEPAYNALRARSPSSRARGYNG